MKSHNPAAKNLKQSVFSTITQLSNKHGAINLAQGFPDFDAPEWILEETRKVLGEGKNQYAPSFGVYSLREQISSLYQKLYNLTYNPENEVLITNGATEAIYATVQALVEPGDEVIAFEPLFDSYASSVQMARGVLKPVTLHLPDFRIDVKELASQVSEKTKLLIFNNPHNPTGRVFDKEEINEIAQLAEKYDFYILSDEVYEHLSFDKEFIPTAAFESLKQRTVTTSSVGKTLSLTGWKVGWACGPAHLIETIHKVHQYICFSVSHPFQVALARSFEKWPEYLQDFRKSYSQKRELLVSGLKDCNASVIKPEGTYFSVVSTPGIKDWEFCEKLILENQVATIPMSPFYLKSNEGEKLIRFCFAKENKTIKSALRNLKEVNFK